MPTYTYKCPSCGATDEAYVKMSLADILVLFCESCHCDMERIISPVAVSFKGGGFYSTDNRLKHHSVSSKQV